MSSQSLGINQSDENRSFYKPFNEAFITMLGEALFIIVPIIVVALFLAFKGTIHTIFSRPEWSFANVVLSGQSIVKLVSVVAGQRISKLRVYNLSLILSIDIVVLLIPSAIILSFLVTTDSPSSWLITAQMILFSLDLMAFIVLGAVGQTESLAYKYLLPENTNNAQVSSS